MKTAAIIAEYNPLHKGHEFHLSATRSMTGADYILVVMSGDFVQRGAPALLNKYLRTRMALAAGADLVMELPSRYALSSAEYFAEGAVSLIDQLGVVDILSFGSECGDTDKLVAHAAHLLEMENNPDYSDSISSYQKKGISYPAAIAQVMSDSHETVSMPNDILGMTYCKALLRLHSNIQPFTIPRSGEGYHSTMLSKESGYSSASALREVLRNCNYSIDEALSDPAFVSQIPQSVLPIWNLDIRPSYGIGEEDFSTLLHYKLLSRQAPGYSSFQDCSRELSSKIQKHLPEYNNYSDFCQLLKSKDITMTRIHRVMMHILLDMKEDIRPGKASSHNQPTPYGRILGFRKTASPLLNSIKNQSSIPLIAKPADASNLLTSEALALFEEDVRIAHIYETVSSDKNNMAFLNEYRQSPIIV